jgi:hypothetical protein
MVSNTLHIDLQDLLKTIKGMRAKYAKSAEYQKLRRDLPEDWPL